MKVTNLTINMNLHKIWSANKHVWTYLKGDNRNWVNYDYSLFVVILNDIFFISQNVVEMDATAIIHSYKLL